MHLYIYTYVNIKVLYIQEPDLWLPWKVEGRERGRVSEREKSVF